MVPFISTTAARGIHRVVIAIHNAKISSEPVSEDTLSPFRFLR